MPSWPRMPLTHSRVDRFPSERTGLWNHPAADAELREAVRWYEAQREGLGSAFLDMFEQTREWIEHAPGACSPVGTDPGVRRARMKRFPYDVIVEERPDGQVILAVAHVRRLPGYWRDRRS